MTAGRCDDCPAGSHTDSFRDALALIRAMGYGGSDDDRRIILQNTRCMTCLALQAAWAAFMAATQEPPDPFDRLEDWLKRTQAWLASGGDADSPD